MSLMHRIDMVKRNKPVYPDHGKIKDKEERVRRE